MGRPDFLPVTVMFISFKRDRRFFRASIDGGFLVMFTPDPPLHGPNRQGCAPGGLRYTLRSDRHRPDRSCYFPILLVQKFAQFDEFRRLSSLFNREFEWALTCQPQDAGARPPKAFLQDGGSCDSQK